VRARVARLSAKLPGPYQADDDAARDAARQIEQDNPRWIVVFGIYTRQFVCFPRFRAVPGTVVTALYPPAAVTRMSEIERTYEIKGEVTA
jgi:hypothetical protein